MKNKNKIGVLVMLGGVALLGYYYFKREKPIVATIQSQDLKKQSDYYGSGTGSQQDTKINFKYEVAPRTNAFGFNPFMQDLDFSKVSASDLGLDSFFTKETYNAILESGNPLGLHMVEFAKSIKQ